MNWTGLVPNAMRENRNGFALEATLFVMLLVSVLIVASFSGVVSVTRTANLDYRNTRVNYAAEAGADALIAQIDLAMQDDGALTDPELAALTMPSVSGFTYDSPLVSRVGAVVVETITDGPFSGLFALTQKIDIKSTAYDPMKNKSEVIITAKAQSIPIFQFGVFYEEDLEITNGPPLDFDGWVHSNDSIYISSWNSFYHDKITTPRHFFHNRRDRDIVYDGVTIDDASGSPYTIDFDSRTHPVDANFVAKSEAAVDGRLKTGAFGVSPLAVPLPTGMPPITVIQPRVAGDDAQTQAAKFAWKADWYIEVDLSSPTASVCARLTHTRPAGKVVPNGGDCNDIFTGGWELFYEGREGIYADVIDINLAKLFDWVGGAASRETNILYMTFTGTGPSIPGAQPMSNAAGGPDGFYPVVRLIEGKDLENPLTVATDHPLYVWGHYNTDNTWQPASLVGDAITFLSKDWKDCHKGGGVGDIDEALHCGPGYGGFIATNADDTDIHAAILAGHSVTPCDWIICGDPQPYGGGLENFPRFLENWSGGETLLYRGSLVSLYQSQKAALQFWGCCSYYVPPTRNWRFDTRFEDPLNLPPGTPVVGQVIHTAFRPVY